MTIKDELLDELLAITRNPRTCWARTEYSRN